MAVFVMGSPQFGNPRALDVLGRPFRSVAEMDAHIVERINAVCTRRDYLYMLGNVFPRGTPASIMGICAQFRPSVIIAKGPVETRRRVWWARNRTGGRVEFKRSLCRYVWEGEPQEVQFTFSSHPRTFEECQRVVAYNWRGPVVPPAGPNSILLCGGEYHKPHEESAPWTFNPALEQNDYTPVALAKVLRIVRARG